MSEQQQLPYVPPTKEEQETWKRTPTLIPDQARVSTLTVVWAKDGNIYCSYPQQPHLSTQMLAVAMKALADAEMQRFQQAQVQIAELEKKLAEQRAGGPLIVPAKSIPVDAKLVDAAKKLN